MTSSGAGPVTEIARFVVKPGAEDAFVAAYHTVRHEIADSPGCRSVRLGRGVESPSAFVLLVEWDTLDAHTKGFRESDGFGRWRAAIGPYFAVDPSVEHVAGVDTPWSATSGQA